MFGWFKLKKYKKNKEIRVFVCKHCKFTCRGCEETYCISCFANQDFECPNCGKTNSSYEKEKALKDNKSS